MRCDVMCVEWCSAIPMQQLQQSIEDSGHLALSSNKHPRSRWRFTSEQFFDNSRMIIAFSVESFLRRRFTLTQQLGESAWGNPHGMRENWSAAGCLAAIKLRCWISHYFFVWRAAEGGNEKDFGINCVQTLLAHDFGFCHGRNLTSSPPVKRIPATIHRGQPRSFSIFIFN